MAEVKLFGYCDRLSVRPGEVLDCFVSADGTDQAKAQLVRLIHGDEHPSGPGYIEEEIDWPENGAWSVDKQFTQTGNYFTVEDPNRHLALDGDITLCCFVWPTLHGEGKRQTLLGRWDIQTGKGYALGINHDGYAEFWVGDGAEIDYITAEVPLLRQMWYFIAVSYNAASGVTTLYQECVLNRYNSLLGKVAPLEARSHLQTNFRFRADNDSETPFLIGGARDYHERRGYFVSQCYNGKIDRPAVFSRVLSREELDRIRIELSPPQEGLVAWWESSAGYTDKGIGDELLDTGPHALHGQGINRPVRAMTGHNWAGFNDCFRLAPDEYGGIEFHADALSDCRWNVTRRVELPQTLKSGIYAVRLRADGKGALTEEYIVFFVRPSKPSAPILLQIPTASYVAYANERLSFDAEIVQPIAGQSPIVSEHDIELYQTPDFGLSTYDHHADGAGVCYSSSRRPILNMRPKCRMSSMGITWQLPADLSIIGWLEHHGFDYEVLTDEDVHREGRSALSPYQVVITGSHPEYYSESMLDATEDYIADGGRFIYMGGNGFYWNVAWREDEPWLMEVRKLDSGMRAWAARPGEHYLATNGQKSGLWKNLGRPPQKLCGVGFISQGFDSARPLRRMPDSWHRTVSWITEGLEEEIFGEHGLAHEGAAGIEMDRYDLNYGTPPNARIIASSGGHSDNYMLVCEEILYQHPGLTGTHDYRIRADMVYFNTPNDGAVFTTGSIAYSQSLPYNRFENDASTVLKNVLAAFSRPGKLPGSHWVNDEKQWR
ncbi:MAG: LamG domain-containing protein [Gammaproteobacteria bacterium]|nr:LamG domain-containing protein [Gammaproteobacteria bacterium]